MNNKIEKISFMQAKGLLLARRSGTLRRAGVINNILYKELSPDGKNRYTIEKIDSIVKTNSFKTKIKETEVWDKIISGLTVDFITSKLSSIFAKIPSDKSKVIEKFFREGQSAPYPPFYYINSQYRFLIKNNKKEYGEYIKEKIIQKNIDDYVTQQKNKYVK